MNKNIIRKREIIILKVTNLLVVFICVKSSKLTWIKEIYIVICYCPLFIIYYCQTTIYYGQTQL
jgi:hypothetical protein